MRIQQRRNAVFIQTALLFAAALMLRACAAGFTYKPILDDTIQYLLYPTSNSYWQLIMQEGLFASRPLAILADLFLVGPFSDCLIVPALFFAVLHGVSGTIFTRLFHKYFQVGGALTVLYALLPLGVEGTYWLSAAARIVPGLFFCALAAQLLDQFLERGGWWRTVLFFLFSLCAMGLYEQTLVVTVTLSGLQFLSFIRENRRAAAALLTLPAAGVYVAFTGYFSAAGALGARMETVFPTSIGYYVKTFLPDILRQMGAAFLKGGWRTLIVGFWRGLCDVASVGGVIYLLLALAVAAAVFFLFRPADAGKNTRKITQLGAWQMALIWGILLFIAPLTPYLVIANPWFSLRATVTSFLGAGILIDLALRALCRNGNIYAGIAAAMTAVFLIAGASEVRDYRAAAEADDTIAAELLSHANEFHGRVGLIGMGEFAAGEQNYAYHEHIASVGSSEWALSSKMVAAGAVDADFSLVPLATTEYCFYHGWNTETKRLAGFDQLYAWDAQTMTATQLDIVQTGENDFSLYLPSGALYAQVWEEDGYGYIEVMG